MAGTGIQQKDTTFTKIFVGGLPYHTTDQSLREFFEQFGDIEEAVVITDRQTGKSRGYGFVTMSDRAAAERACKDPNPIIDGRKANVNLAYLGAKPRVQTGESALPFALKAGIPGFVQSQYGLPQYIYPGGYIAAASPSVMAMSAQSPLSPTAAATGTAAGQVFDYTAAAAAAAAAGYQATGQLPSAAAAAAGFEAAGYPYSATAASTYINPATYATYAAAAVPQTSALAGFAAYQPQQIQERMQ